MSPRQILKRLEKVGGCVGGIVVYDAAKAVAAVLNIGKGSTTLHAHTMARMQPYFPRLDLGRVRVVPRASLPGSWIRSGVEAMTFGYVIYCRDGDIEDSTKGRKLLLHELVHVDQVRRRGDREHAFACAYGKGFLDAGSYRDNPLEVEAYDFVAATPWA